MANIFYCIKRISGILANPHQYSVFKRITWNYEAGPLHGHSRSHSSSRSTGAENTVQNNRMELDYRGSVPGNSSRPIINHRFYSSNGREGQSSDEPPGKPSSTNYGWYGAIAGGVLVVGGLGIWNKNLHAAALPFGKTSQAVVVPSLLTSSAGAGAENASDQVVTSLPTYKLAEVAEHYDAERRVWVTFHRGVYDVTDFVAKHPGGERIMMAAGGSLEPFWELYPTHQRPDVFEILERHRIGNLVAEDQVKLDDADTGHFKNEPKRHPVFHIRAQKPFNGETPPVLLTQKYYTPNEVFYVRNHLPVPVVDINSYRLDIDGLGIKSTSFSLEQLKKFPQDSVTATIQCGGNRRTEMGIVKPVAGLGWTGGAIGNAEWTGVRLKDVLRAAGFEPQKYKNPHLLHIQFEGLDSDQSGECYGSSIPFSYMLDDNFQPILAFEMNQRPLPTDHGYPVRVILPGIVGARSVKWLGRIVISEQECQSPWQQRDYKVFSPSVTMETVDFSAAPAIQDTPVTSYLCSHKPEELVPPGPTTIEGYAFSGGGRTIVRVEISIDQGKTWSVASLSSDTAGKDKTRNWAWSLWKTELDLTGKRGEVEVWVKAVDSGYNQQAESFSTIYNYRGLLSNAIHKTKLKISK